MSFTVMILVDRARLPGRFADSDFSTILLALIEHGADPNVPSSIHEFTYHQICLSTAETIMSLLHQVPAGNPIARVVLDTFKPLSYSGSNYSL